MHPPKVVRLITRLNIGGPALHALLLTEQLPQNGFESILVTGLESPTEGNMLDLIGEQEIKPIIIPELGRAIKPLKDFRAFWKIYKFLLNEKPQIVHTHMAKAGFIGRLAALCAGVPLIIHTFHGHVFHGYFSPLKTQLFIYLERFLGRFTDKIIAVSKIVKSSLHKYGIAPLNKISVIPLGFKLDKFLHKRCGFLRTELKLSQNIKLVGIIGRLVPIKNHHLFFKAAQEVIRVYPHVKFIVVGEGELRNKLKNEVFQLGIREHVIFLGWRSDLSDIYADLNVVVISSVNEGTPVSLIEGMACCCPAVATRVGGVPDVIEEGINGYLVNPGDAKKMAQALVKILRDPIKAREMGQAGQKKVVFLYTVQRLSENITTLYHTLLEKESAAQNACYQ